MLQLDKVRAYGKMIPFRPSTKNLMRDRRRSTFFPLPRRSWFFFPFTTACYFTTRSLFLYFFKRSRLLVNGRSVQNTLLRHQPIQYRTFLRNIRRVSTVPATTLIALSSCDSTVLVVSNSIVHVRIGIIISYRNP